jgi:hypothetical protein
MEHKRIYINWDGPFTAEEIRGKTGKTDYGIYQVYGNHRIYGRDVLLYVGRAVQQTFGVRIPQHLDWFDWTENQQTYYLGRLHGIHQIPIAQWDHEIDLVERYLIDYCQSAWNASGLNSGVHRLPKLEIFNYGVKRSLPPVLPLSSNSTKVIYDSLKPYSTARKSDQKI